jgi:predicted phosphodiesterase
VRIAILSDVHGFNLALEAVLEDLDTQGAFDEVIVAGDHCALGPAPVEALDRLLERGFTLLMGNTDLVLVEGAESILDDPEVSYAVPLLGPDRLDILAKLPFSRRITPPGGVRPGDDLLVVHATPHSLVDRFDPDWSDEELRQVVGSTRAGAIAFGHYHVCFVRQVDDVLLVDVAAVGNPKDGDLRSKYGILTWNADVHRWTAEIRKIDYPLEATERQIRDRGMPDAEKVIKRLRRASYKKV